MKQFCKICKYTAIINGFIKLALSIKQCLNFRLVRSCVCGLSLFSSQWSLLCLDITVLCLALSVYPSRCHISGYLWTKVRSVKKIEKRGVKSDYRDRLQDTLEGRSPDQRNNDYFCTQTKGWGHPPATHVNDLAADCPEGSCCQLGLTRAGLV